MGVPVGIAPVALQQFSDVNGTPLAGGLLYTYASGTTTPLATFGDAGGFSPNPNPVVLDSGGFASPGLFLQALAYTFALADANNVPQWTQDGVVSAEAIVNLKNPSKTIFTTSGTFNIPTNVSGAKVTAIGGGGAGGGSTATFNGGGGGGGAAAFAWLTGLIPGNTINLAIGAGGLGVSGGMGSPGQATIITSGTQTITTITVPGGAGGFSVGATTAGVDAAAAGTGADINLPGTSSGLGTGGVGGSGSPSIFGGGGGGAGAGGFAGNNATGFGAGGGGASAGSNQAGGNGSSGIVIFEFLQ